MFAKRQARQQQDAEAAPRIMKPLEPAERLDDRANYDANTSTDGRLLHQTYYL